MFSSHYDELSAPESPERFARSMGTICEETGAQRFLVLRLIGVSQRRVAEYFHSGGPGVEEMLKAPRGRLAVDRLLVAVTQTPVPSVELKPGMLAITGYDHGCAIYMRGAKSGCLVVFATDQPPTSIMELMMAASASAQSMLPWFALAPAKACPLSERELQCLLYYLASSSTKEAAGALGISARTVEGHLERARIRCGVENTLAAAMMAIDEGWIQPSEVRRLQAAG